MIIVRILVSVNAISLLKILSHPDKDRKHDGIKDGRHIALSMYNSLIVIGLNNTSGYCH